MDYGPARFLNPEDVARASSCLTTTLFDELARHYDLAAMCTARIHFLPDSETEVPSDLEALRHHYDDLTRFFSAAATTGDAIALMLV
jgi:hypothetical protein